MVVMRVANLITYIIYGDTPVNIARDRDVSDSITEFKKKKKKLHTPIVCRLRNARRHVLLNVACPT